MWDQSSGTPTSCSAVTDLMPGTSSKCKISSLTVPITVVTPTGSVQLVKDIVPNSDTGKFNLQRDAVGRHGGDRDRRRRRRQRDEVQHHGGHGGDPCRNRGHRDEPRELHVVACLRELGHRSVGAGHQQPDHDAHPPIGIVCTYTNTRKSATLQLKKQWSNAKVGDSASLTATGIVNSATAALDSTAGSANELDAGSAVTVYAGEVATLGETVNPAANYTSTGPVCTGTSGLSGSTLTVGAADTTIVCTYTNTRKSTTLQLKKQWANANVGDTAVPDGDGDHQQRGCGAQLDGGLGQRARRGQRGDGVRGRGGDAGRDGEPGGELHVGGPGLHEHERAVRLDADGGGGRRSDRLHLHEHPQAGDAAGQEDLGERPGRRHRRRSRSPAS